MGQVAEAERLRRNRLFGCSSTMMLALGFAGFAPAYWARLSHGHWYFNAIERWNGPSFEAAENNFGRRWDVLLTVHALTTLTWMISAVFQVATGATGLAGSKRKTWHKSNGYI